MTLESIGQDGNSRVIRPDGGFWRTLCIKTNSSEPTGVGSGERYSNRAEITLVFLGDIIVDFDWLMKFRVFSCSRLIFADIFRPWAKPECVSKHIKLRNGIWHCIKKGYISAMC